MTLYGWVSDFPCKFFVSLANVNVTTHISCCTVIVVSLITLNMYVKRMKINPNCIERMYGVCMFWMSEFY